MVVREFGLFWFESDLADVHTVLDYQEVTKINKKLDQQIANGMDKLFPGILKIKKTNEKLIQ